MNVEGFLESFRERFHGEGDVSFGDVNVKPDEVVGLLEFTLKMFCEFLLHMLDGRRRCVPDSFGAKTACSAPAVPGTKAAREYSVHCTQ